MWTGLWLLHEVVSWVGVPVILAIGVWRVLRPRRNDDKGDET